MNVKTRVICAIFVWCGVIYARTLTTGLFPWMPVWIGWVLLSGLTAAYVGWEIHTWFTDKKDKTNGDSS